MPTRATQAKCGTGCPNILNTACLKLVEAHSSVNKGFEHNPISDKIYCKPFSNLVKPRIC